MRFRTLLIVAVSVLLTPVSYAMEQSAPSAKARRPSTRRETPPGMDMYYGAPAQPAGERTKDTREIKVFALKYRSASELAGILQSVGSGFMVAVDETSNRLIVTADSVEMQHAEALVQDLDVARAADVGSRPMMCRAYMFELASQYQGLRRFSTTVMGSEPLPSNRVLNDLDGAEIQVESFKQEGFGDGYRFLIGGRAASNQAIQRLLEKIPDCEISELDWQDSTPVMPVTKVAPLPASLQKHVDTFLGKDAGIAGYWFGSLSVPGHVRAPIGPWNFTFQVRESGQDGELELELDVMEQTRGRGSVSILSNSIRGKVGRPVIVGYNRDNQGVLTMGALVIVPEPLESTN